MDRRGGGLLRAYAARLGSELSTIARPVVAAGRLLISGIDGILRIFLAVRPFTEDPACILRISSERSRHELLLSDGTQIQRGDPLIGLHAWNERLRDQGSEEAPLAWGRFLVRRFKSSLRLLAAHLTIAPSPENPVALRAELSFVTDPHQAGRIFSHLGFDVVVLDRPGGRVWRKAFWDNLYACWLMWAYSPLSLRGKRLSDLYRVHIWMSSSRLAELHGRKSRPQARWA